MSFGQQSELGPSEDKSRGDNNKAKKIPGSREASRQGMRVVQFGLDAKILAEQQKAGTLASKSRLNELQDASEKPLNEEWHRAALNYAKENAKVGMTISNFAVEILVCIRAHPGALSVRDGKLIGPGLKRLEGWMASNERFTRAITEHLMEYNFDHEESRAIARYAIMEAPRSKMAKWELADGAAKFFCKYSKEFAASRWDRATIEAWIEQESKEPSKEKFCFFDERWEGALKKEARIVALRKGLSQEDYIAYLKKTILEYPRDFYVDENGELMTRLHGGMDNTNWYQGMDNTNWYQVAESKRTQYEQNAINQANEYFRQIQTQETNQSYQVNQQRQESLDRALRYYSGRSHQPQAYQQYQLHTQYAQQITNYYYQQVQQSKNQALQDGQTYYNTLRSQMIQELQNLQRQVQGFPQNLQLHAQNYQQNLDRDLQSYKQNLHQRTQNLIQSLQQHLQNHEQSQQQFQQQFPPPPPPPPPPGLPPPPPIYSPTNLDPNAPPSYGPPPYSEYG